MAETKSRAALLIMTFYWTLWAYLAVTVGICFAAAPWILPKHAVLLLIAGGGVALFCGLGSLWLLLRSWQDMGPLRRTPLAKWMMVALVVVPAGVITILGVSQYWSDLARLLSKQDRYGSFAYCVTQWSLNYTLFHLYLLTGAAIATLLAGWFLWRRLRPRLEQERTFRHRLLATYLLSACLLLALILGGLELPRRAGLLAFVATYGSEITSLARLEATLRQKIRATTRYSEEDDSEWEPLRAAPWTLTLLDNKEVAAVPVLVGRGWSGAGNFEQGNWSESYCERAICFPLPAGATDEGLLTARLVIDSPEQEPRTIWGPWQERGSTLLLPVPRRPLPPRPAHIFRK